MPEPVKPYRKGDTITASRLNKPLEFLRSVIRGGRGIKVETLGDKIVLSSTDERIIPKSSDKIIVVAAYANLPTSGVGYGARGYTTNDHNRYIFVDTTWRIDGMYRQAAAPSSQGERAGDLWLDTDDNRIRYKDSSTNWQLLPVVNPANNIQAGDIANGSSITSMYYTTSASARVTHI